MSQELTASEASARLGVKRATLYAYVSRGLVHRSLAMDGRTSLFDADEIDNFRSGRRRHSEGELDAVIGTSLTRIGDGHLRVGGVDLVSMVEADTDYEDVVNLLWAGDDRRWTVAPETLAAVEVVQAAMPSSSSGIDRLRVTVSVVSASDPLRSDLTRGAVRSAGQALLIAMVHGLPVLGREVSGERLATRLWPRLTSNRPTPERRAALNAALALLVDHGLAASTFGARVAASVRADPYSVVIAGLGVVGGTLHGAASSAVHEMFDQAFLTGEPGVAVGDAHRRMGASPGFGHLVYRTRDPRYGALMEQVSEAWRDDPRLGTVHTVRELISQRSEAIPNIDLAIGAMTWLAGMERDAGEAVFAIARTAGWLAHGLEEYDEQPLRFRPRARYTGS